MTPAQWMFHYEECMEHRKKDAQREKDFLAAIETFALYSHPNMNLKKLVSSIQQRKLKEAAPELKATLEKDWEMAQKILPKTIEVCIDDEDVNKPILPLSRRKKKARVIRKKRKDF